MARLERQERRLAACSQSPAGLRRSARLKGQHAAKHPDYHDPLHLPSPSLSLPESPLPKHRRKRSNSGKTTQEYEPPKRRRISRNHHETPGHPRDPIAHWVETHTWPDFTNQKTPTVMNPTTPSKRKSSSSHRSDRQQRLQEHGISMKTSALLREASKQLCYDLLAGDRSPEQHPAYPVERTDEVLERVYGLNEARLQRDVTPWLVPSAENLYFSGCTEMECIGEEIQAEWVRCEPMGGSKPKPDFAVGLQRIAFEDGELKKLENYASVRGPFLFTPDLAFPFLVCEAKSGSNAIDIADAQNIHSASMAVRAILRLYIAAYGRKHEKTEALLGRILVFSVSHNNKIVNLYGHYAVAPNGTDESDDSDENLRYFRYEIAMFSLTMGEGRERYKSYNFIRNLYDKFFPEHLERLKDAVGQLPSPVGRTRRSFAASDLAVDDEGSQQDSEAQESGFKIPGVPASVSTRNELRQVREQMDQLIQQLRGQEEQLRDRDDQLRQQREESQREREESQRQLNRLLDIVARSNNV